MHPDKPLKALFNRQQEWLTFLNKHIGHVREAVIENVTKMRACGTAALRHLAPENIRAPIPAAPTSNSSIKPVSPGLAIAVAPKPQSAGCKLSNMSFPIVNGNTSPSPCPTSYGRYSAITARY